MVAVSNVLSSGVGYVIELCFGDAMSSREHREFSTNVVSSELIWLDSSPVLLRRICCGPALVWTYGEVNSKRGDAKNCDLG